MKFDTTLVFKANLEAYMGGYRRALNEGGTSSSKTWSILQLLIRIAQTAPRPTLISIVSETMPHLKKGAMRDWKQLMGDGFNPKCWNATDSIYTYGKGVIEFFSADQPDKQRGPRRQILYINEPNNGVSYDAYDNLDTRTEVFTFLDWNPAGEFWAHEKGLITHKENKYIHSTYKDALNVIPPKYLETILAHKDRDPNWWHVYGEGLLGKIEGLVFPFFEQVDALPQGEAFYGLDFGYSNDPSVLVECVIAGDKLYCQELIYEAGLTNDAIAHRMDEVGVKRNHDEIFADAAEPKSIDEIHKFGFNIKPAPKGADSVKNGIQRILQYKQFWTKDSIKCIKEQRNFRYIKDKDDKLTEKTTHEWSHGMDARRYGVAGRAGRVKPEIVWI